jgi:PilZ domain
MPVPERRSARRFIMKVPLKFRPMRVATQPEETAASMNISTHGVFFATDQKVPKGLMLQVHLKMPREVVGDEVTEWCFTGRVAHVESLGATKDKSGVGVQFLYYEVPPASLEQYP